MFMSVLVFDQFIDNHQIRFKIILPLSSSRDTSIFVNVLFCMWHSAELKALHKQSCEIGFPSSFSRSPRFYLFQTQDMKKYALSLIVRHFPKVAPLPKLRTLSHSLLLVVCDFDDFGVDFGDFVFNGFRFTLLFGASELNVDGLFSHRFNVNFFVSVGVYSKQGIDVIVPFILSYKTSFVFINFFCSRQ